MGSQRQILQAFQKKELNPKVRTKEDINAYK